MKITIALNAFLLSSASKVPMSPAFRTLSQRTSTLTKNLPRAILSANPGLDRHLEDPCTPCAGGLEPTNLDGTINLPEDMADEGTATMTCEQGSALVGAFPADDESCPMFQLIGHAFCGCPAPPTIDGVEICSLCYDGSPVPDPELGVDVGSQFGEMGEDLTCGQAQLGVGFMGIMVDAFSDINTTEIETTLEDEAGADPSVDDICPMMQTSIGTLCGCPENPDQPKGCGVCPEGFTLSNPAKEFEIEDGNMMTCGAGNLMALQVPSDDDLCSEVQADAKSFGCECLEDDSAGFANTISGFITFLGGALAVSMFM